MKKSSNDSKLVSDLIFDNLKRNQSDLSQRKSSNIQFKVVYKKQNAPQYNHYHSAKGQNSCYPLPIKQRKKTSYKKEFESEQRKNVNNPELQNNAIKKVSVQFECGYKKKDNSIRASPQRQSSMQLLQKGELSTLLTCSMKKYMGKIDRIKQKKLSKFQLIQNFGLNVQSIKHQKSSVQLKAPQSSKFKTNRLSAFTSVPVSKPKCKTQKSQSISQSIRKKHTKKFAVYESMSRQEDNTILAKQKRMLNCLSVILYSYGCFQKRVSQVERKLQKSYKQKKHCYLYFIGPGNNRNMIRSLMKKRWWWIQTDDINKANFIWTQLRQNHIVEKHSKLIFGSRTVQKDVLMLHEDSIQLKNAMINISALRLFHRKFNPKFYNKLSQQQEIKKLYEIQIPQILHNHYSFNVMIGNKKALFHNLSQYCKFYNEDLSSFFPLTFHIDNSTGADWQNFQKYALANKNAIWIVKPGENSNRGQNIFVSDNPTYIKLKIKQMEKQHTFIIQKYIKNVFLYHKRKFDIRTYLLMVTIGGQSKFYWYHEGYIRTSSEIFNTQDLFDISIHLTNDAIQCQHQNYGKYEIGNKLSYHEFDRYLNSHYPSQYSIRKLDERMKQIAVKVVKAAYNKIDLDKRDFGFELFGMDFLVDQDFNPLLLQVNTNPCLQLAATCLERLIPWMVQNVFRLTIDPIFPPSCECPRSLICYIPDNLMQRNRFELIFDTIFDSDQQWQKYCQNLGVEQKYDDEQEQFDNEGEIIQLQNY